MMTKLKSFPREFYAKIHYQTLGGQKRWRTPPTKNWKNSNNRFGSKRKSNSILWGLGNGRTDQWAKNSTTAYLAGVSWRTESKLVVFNSTALSSWPALPPLISRRIEREPGEEEEEEDVAITRLSSKPVNRTACTKDIKSNRNGIQFRPVGHGRERERAEISKFPSLFFSWLFREKEINREREREREERTKTSEDL